MMYSIFLAVVFTFNIWSSPIIATDGSKEEDTIMAARTNNGSYRHPHKKPRIDRPFDEVAKELYGTLQQLGHSLIDAYEDADTDAIKAAYYTFKSLRGNQVYTPRHWQKALDNAKEWLPKAFSQTLYSWPRDNGEKLSPYETIAGHLFYPPDTNQLLSSPYQDYLLERKDRVRAFAIATKFHNPLAEYYLTRTLDEIRGSVEGEEEKPAFFKEHYRHALTLLQQCGDQSDACYVVGRNYGCEGIKVGVLDFDVQKAYEYYIKGKDARSQLQALHIQRVYKTVYDKEPTLEEFIALAEREKYGPAYVEAADIVNDEAKKIEYLNKAIELGYYPAHIKWGHIYFDRNEFSEAMRYYGEAGKNGIAYGYLLQGALIAGGANFSPATIFNRRDFLTLTEDEIKQVEHYFILASEAKDPRGWEYLAQLYIKLYVATPFGQARETELKFKASQALEEAIKLGASLAYGFAKNEFPNLIKGKTLPDDRYMEIENFLTIKKNN